MDNAIESSNLISGLQNSLKGINARLDRMDSDATIELRIAGDWYSIVAVIDGYVYSELASGNNIYNAKYSLITIQNTLSILTIKGNVK